MVWKCLVVTVPLHELLLCSWAQPCPDGSKGAALFSAAQPMPWGQPDPWCFHALRAFISVFTSFLPALALLHSLQWDFASHPSVFETPSPFRSCHCLPLRLVPSPALLGCLLLKGVKQTIAQFFGNFHRRGASPCSCLVGAMSPSAQHRFLPPAAGEPQGRCELGCLTAPAYCWSRAVLGSGKENRPLIVCDRHSHPRSLLSVRRGMQ